MKKQIFISILVFLSCWSIYGQEDSRKTVAVIPAEGESVSREIKNGITNGLEEGVYKSGGYKLLARGDAFAKALTEMKFQQESGAVADNQLIQFGHALGANFVCYASVDKYSDELFRISFRMIDVASGEIVNVGSETVRTGVSGLLDATDNIAKKLFGSDNGAPSKVSAPKPTDTGITGDNSSKSTEKKKITSARNSSQLRVAVFDPISSSKSIDEGTKIAINEIISSTLVNTGKYIIVEHSILQQVMNEQKISNTDALDDSEVTKLGRLADADKIVLPAISMVGGRSMFTIKIIDVETATIEQQKTRIAKSNGLLDIVEPLTLDLIGEKITAFDK